MKIVKVSNRSRELRHLFEITVYIFAVGYKEGGRLFIHGKEYKE